MDTARSLLQTIGRYGCPSIILSDSGTEFRNEMVEGLCQYLGISRTFTHPGSHQENAVSERVNREIDRHLSHITQEKNAKYQWSDYLPLVQRIINTSVHTALKVSPHDLIFATNRLDTEFLSSVNRNIPEDMISYTHYIDSVLTKHELIMKEAMENEYKRRRTHMLRKPTKATPIYRQGTLVLKMLPISATTGKAIRSTRLDTKWTGPYVITSRHKDDKTYNLKHLATNKRATAQVFELKQYVPDKKSDDYIKSTFEIAARDTAEIEIYRIHKHRFLPTPQDSETNRNQSLFFLVEYKELSSNELRWVPWTVVKSQNIVHQYLHRHNLGYLIPKYTRIRDTRTKLDKQRKHLIRTSIQSHHNKLKLT